MIKKYVKCINDRNLLVSNEPWKFGDEKIPEITRGRFYEFVQEKHTDYLIKCDDREISFLKCRFVWCDRNDKLNRIL
jgi:hypothetical protein